MLRWGIVGFGEIADIAVAPAIKAHESSELVAICRRNPDKLRAFATKFAVPRAYTDYGEMLDRGGLDAVYVASPVNLHAPQALAAIERGLHVLVEKPMALNADECQSMIRAASGAGATLGVAFYHRFFPINVRIREIVLSGEIGDLVALHGNASFPFNLGSEDPKIWRIDAAQSGGGPLMDVGSHRLDIFHSLAGPAARVAALTDRRLALGDVEDAATLLIGYRSGVQGTLSCLWSVDPGRSDYDVWCTRGHIGVASIRGEEFILERGGSSERYCLPGRELRDYPLVADFVAAVEGRSPHTLPGEAGLEVQMIMDAAYESSRAGTVVVLDG